MFKNTTCIFCKEKHNIIDERLHCEERHIVTILGILKEQMRTKELPEEVKKDLFRIHEYYRINGVKP
jgi:hypothetical protein